MRTEDRVLDLLVHILMDLLIDIPELSSLPKFSSMADRHIFNLSTQILMQLVSQNQASFRVLVASLPSSKKVKLERALKSISTSSDLSPGTAKAESKSSPSGSAPAVLAQPSLAPKIQLKNFASFGS